MLLHIHLAIGYIIGTILMNVFNVSQREFFIFLLSGIAIDFDHVVYMFFAREMFPLRENVKRYKYYFKNMIPKFYFMHTLESMVALLILVIYDPDFIWVFYGCLLHLSLDMVKYIKHYKDLSWIKHWCIIWNLKDWRVRRSQHIGA